MKNTESVMFICLALVFVSCNISEAYIKGKRAEHTPPRCPHENAEIIQDGRFTPPLEIAICDDCNEWIIPHGTYKTK